MLRVWDTNTGKLEIEFEGHTAGISDVAWAPDSRVLATGSDDKTIRLWDIKSVCCEVSSFNNDSLEF